MAKDRKNKDKKKKDAKVKVDRTALMAVGRYELDDDDKELDKKNWWWAKANRNIPEVISANEKKAEEEFREGKDWVFGTIEKTGSDQVDSKFSDVAKGVFEPSAGIAKTASSKVSGKATGAISRALSKFVFAFKEKRKRKRNALLIGGMVTGAAVGAVIGTLLLPVIGTAIGGAVGAAISAAAGVGAAVVLGTLGAWAGLSGTRAVSKKTMPESKSNYKLSKRDLKKVNENTNLDNIEIEKLHAYVRNRERQLDEGTTQREKLKQVRQRAFKKGSKQGMEHLIYFLADDLKALNQVKEPSSKQLEDQAFLINTLTKLEKEDELNVHARNYIRTELFHEEPLLELPAEEKKILDDIEDCNSFEQLFDDLDDLEKHDRHFVNKLTGERDIEIRDVRRQIRKINEALKPSYDHMDAWDEVSKILNQKRGLAQLHREYPVHEKVYELIKKELNKQAEIAKQKMEEKGDYKISKAQELRDVNPKEAFNLQQSGGRYFKGYQNKLEQARKAELAFEAIKEGQKPVLAKREEPIKPDGLGSHRIKRGR